MGKARRLMNLALLKRPLLPILGTSVGVVGAVSAVLGILDIHFSLLGTSLLAVIALAGSASFHLFRLAAPQVAVDDVIAPDDDDHAPLALHCPCDIKLASEASRLADECYSGSITIDANVFEQLRVKNPLILACLTDRRGQFVGYFDIIPLYEPFARSLIQGHVTESKISHEDVVPPQQMKSSKYLFISGIAVRNPNTYSGRRSASILVWALLKYLDRHYGRTNAVVFALAATPEGDELLQRFKLRQSPGGTMRMDRYKLYSIPLSNSEIERRLVCMPNWELLCDLPWPDGRRRSHSRKPTLPQTKAFNLA